MNFDHDYLTGIRADWSEHNLSTLSDFLREAYVASAEKTDPGLFPPFETPNRAMLLGTMRWFLVDSLLYEAAQSGRFYGIQSKWVPLSDSVYACELVGKYTSLVPHHLQNPDDAPRHSTLRFDRRRKNYQNPMLPIPGLAPDGDSEIGLINLTMVHGDKEADFAMLRIYHNPEKPKQFLRASDNILLTPRLVTQLDVEEVAEPVVQPKERTGFRKAIGE